MKENLRVAKEQEKQNSEEIFSTLTGAEMWLNMPQNSGFQHSPNVTLQIQYGQAGFEIPPLLWTLQISINLEKDLKPEKDAHVSKASASRGKGKQRGCSPLQEKLQEQLGQVIPLWDWTVLNTASTRETWKQKQISLPNHIETCNKVNCQTASLAFLLKLTKGTGFKHQFCWQMGWHCNSISST